MHENFIALDREKRDRIINAAMREFSERGFKNASTNKITKNSGISKSLLFYYFSSKEDLFRFLYRYKRDFMRENVEPYFKNMPSDVFERLRTLSILKLEIAALHPDISDFSRAVFQDNNDWVQNFLKNEFDQFSNELSYDFYEGIDTSKFKPDLDVKQALKIIGWTLEGAGVSKLREVHDTTALSDRGFQEAMMREFDSYLSVLKKIFYMEEFV